MINQEKIILGIDPGSLIMGYGLIQISHSKTTLLTLGYLELKKYPEQFERLKHIFSRVEMLIKEYNPTEFAIEAPFYGKNVQSMLKLGRAQGIAIAAALYHNLEIFEYSPRKIKQSITGNGNASKEQVALMLQRILDFKDMPQYLDATDAVAAAVCHSNQNTLSDKENKVHSWKEFIQKNKDRLV